MISLHVQRRELAGQIMGVMHDLLDEREHFFRFRSTGMLVLGEALVQPFEHEHQAGQFLTGLILSRPSPPISDLTLNRGPTISLSFSTISRRPQTIRHVSRSW